MAHFIGRKICVSSVPICGYQKTPKIKGACRVEVLLQGGPARRSQRRRRVKVKSNLVKPKSLPTSQPTPPIPRSSHAASKRNEYGSRNEAQIQTHEENEKIL
jgi:hypothetical protein